MKRFNVFTALVAGGLACAAPAQAAGTQSQAEKLRRLDIMLMVTGLRCRGGPDDFMADYSRFTARHMATLNAANVELRGRFGQRMLDRLSTSIANQYGRGHPWLGCRDLRSVARNLVNVRGSATLVEAADQILAPRAGQAWAYGGR